MNFATIHITTDSVDSEALILYQDCKPNQLKSVCYAQNRLFVYDNMTGDITILADYIVCEEFDAVLYPLENNGSARSSCTPIN